MGEGDGNSVFATSPPGPCSLDRETKGSCGLGRDRLHAARVKQHGRWPLTVDVRIDDELAILDRNGKDGGLRQHTKAVSLEYGCRFRRGQESQIFRRLQFCILGHRHRVDDRWVRVFGEYAYNLHTWVDFCISFINDPKRCPTTGDKDESGAHVLSVRQFRFHARPDTELLQRSL